MSDVQLFWLVVALVGWGLLIHHLDEKSDERHKKSLRESGLLDENDNEIPR